MSTLSGGPNVVVDGLVLWLDAANTKSYVSGSTTWNDISRNGLIGTLSGGPAFNTGSGGSIVFDGVNDYINCGNSTIFDLNQHSICFWFYPKEQAVKEIIYKSRTALSDPGPYEIFQSNNNISYRLNFSATPNITTTGTIPLKLNTWQYICATYDNIAMKTYINNVIDINTIFTTVLTNSTGNVNIGAYTDGRYPMLANMAQVSMYNRALSQAEITQNYNALKSRFNLT